MQQLVSTVLTEWDILASKVKVAVTDNESNMVAAYHTMVESTTEEVDSVNDDEGNLDEDADTIDDFDECEENHDVTFNSVGMPRIGCFAHTLQLVVQVLEKFDGFKEILKHTCQLICKVNSSTKVTECLVAMCGKKLLKDCPTRWGSTFSIIDCLIDVRQPLSSVLQGVEWDNLATSAWKTLQSIKTLLQPFADFTSPESVSANGHNETQLLAPVRLNL